MEIKVIESHSEQIDTTNGFVYITVQINQNFVTTLQCCLVARKDKNGYKKEVNRKDSGFDDGICWDVNKKAYNQLGCELSDLRDFFMKEIKHIGVRVRK